MKRLSSLKKISAFIAKNIGWLSNVLLSLLLAGLGWFAVQWRELIWPKFGDEVVDWQEMGMDPFQRLSYDLPFITRHSLPGWMRQVAGGARSTDEVVILYMDEESTKRLNQPPGGPWSRAMHAKLVNWLTKDGARAVMFDVIFDSESPEDPAFIEALSQNGKVVLGATINTNTEAPLTPEEAQRFLEVGIATEQLSKRNKALYKAAYGWGLLTFRPVDSDYGVRRLYPGKPREGLDPWPSATWQLAKAIDAKLPEDDATRFSHRWLNYYGPARRIESLSYYRALDEAGGVPPGYFKDKVVIIGARSQLGSGPKKLLDEFSTPWSRFGGRAYTPGAEIHATSFLNLLHHDWLQRVPVHSERWFVVILGLLLGGLRWLRPWHAIITAVTLAVLLFAAACLLQWHSRVWFNWAVPVLLQIPLAGMLAVASRYYREERRKRQLRNAFGFYLSRGIAQQVEESNFNIAPGGHKVVATMVFTDLEGFTTLSEKLGDSTLLGEELVRYFTRTTHEIHAQNGFPVKFIGDAVFAAWGVPLPQADQAERAVRAAWRIGQVSEMDVAILRPDGTTENVHIGTRIGIHTGEALAGNLGSAGTEGSPARCDYTLIGDNVNVAARLEGANKYFDTNIILSDATAQQLGGKFLLRRLGAFKLKGKVNSLVIHELLGEDATARPTWLDTFDAALHAWNTGDFATAETQFQKVMTLRDGSDGPSSFYLARIPQAPAPADWTGEVAMDEK